jgi:hypothetical protein
MHTHSASTSQITICVSITKTILLMLYNEIVPVLWKIYRKHKQMVWEKLTLLNVKTYHTKNSISN